LIVEQRRQTRLLAVLAALLAAIVAVLIYSMR
jgi:hypothetical protein